MSMKIFTHLFLYSLAIVVSAKVIPGVEVATYADALFVAVILSVLNATVRPILLFLTLPITILTLGFFALVINTLMVLIASVVISGFYVPSFLSALGFGVVLSLIHGILARIAENK